MSGSLFAETDYKRRYYYDFFIVGGAGSAVKRLIKKLYKRKRI